MRGMADLFKRRSVYWIAYYHRGKEHRESSHSEKRKEVSPIAQRRIGEVGTGRFTGPRRRAGHVRRPRQGAADGLRNQPAPIGPLSATVDQPSARVFGLERAVDITTDRIKAYASARQRERRSECEHQPRAGGS